MIELKNVSKIYKSINNEMYALKDICLSISEGEFVAVMGKSGSGKSTMLNILGCMDFPNTGDYIYNDVIVNKLSPNKADKFRKENIAFIFQQYELMSRFNVYENIEMPLRARRIRGKVKKDKILNIMDRLGIAELRDKFPNQLSGGEQQRVAIARAYVSDCHLLLADEPTGALDSVNTIEIMNIFKELNKEGNTIIMATHDREVASYADRIVTISNGEITKNEV